MSYGRCLLSGERFFDDFYATFMATSPRVASMFRNTDMPQQKSLLRRAISYVISAGEGGHFSSLAHGELARLSKTHGREHLDVDPSLYAFWVESLIKTVQAHDAEFSATLEGQWRTTLQTAVETMRSAY